MLCPNCGETNPDAAKFCMNCAHDLSQVESESQTDRYFKYIPEQLEKKLSQSAKLGGMQKERRIVTALFCDMQGSTAAAENLDPEDWTEIVDQAFDHLIPPVYEYEGVVARLMGDAILAFFGAPISHEDDAERAILAALKIVENMSGFCRQMKDEWKLDTNVRVGINTGLVVVGEIGSTDMQVEYTAMGDAINVAARMEETAEPGTIQITSETNKRIAYMFETEKLPAISIKGKSEPVVPFRVLGRKRDVDSKRGFSGFDLRFIGRENEFNTLTSEFDTMRSGVGRVVGIWGDAGIGKSRLIRELHNHLRINDLIGGVDAVNWLETAPLAYQTSVPYAPFIELFNREFKLDFDLDGETKYKRLIQGLRDASVDINNFPFFASFLGLPIPEGDPTVPLTYEPYQIQLKVVASIVNYLHAKATQAPTLLILDDVHWIDNTSLAVVREITKITSSSKLLLIMVSRYEGEEQINELVEPLKESPDYRFTEIELQPFDLDDANLLIASLLKIEDLPQELREIIIERSEGIPFYLEEMIRALMDLGEIVQDGDTWKVAENLEVRDIKVPENLTALLITRLDQLDEETRRLAQSASVIGREFLISVLNCISEYGVDEPLKNLESHDWIVENETTPEREYFFKHVLSRDVAYDSLLMKRRRELHNKIANCIRNINSSEVGEIGRHFYEAMNYSDALPYFLKSAAAAMGANSNFEATQIFKQALEIIDESANFEVLKQILSGLTMTSAMLGNLDESDGYGERMLSESQVRGDVEGEVTALTLLASNRVYITGEVDRAEEYLEKAENLAREVDFVEGIIHTSAIRCSLYQGIGQLDKAAKWETIGADAASEAKDARSYLLLRNNLVVSYVLTYQIEKAKVEAEKLLAAARASGIRYYEAQVFSFVHATHSLIDGDFGQARMNVLKGLEIAEELNAELQMTISRRLLFELETAEGNYSAASEQVELAIAANQGAADFGMLASLIFSKLGFMKRLGFPAANDEELIEMGMRFLQAPFGEYWGTKSWTDLGYYFLLNGNPDQAHVWIDKALTVPAAPFIIYRPLALYAKVKTLVFQGKTAECGKVLQEAKEHIDSHGMVIYGPELHLLEGAVHLLDGEPEASIHDLRVALEESRKIGMVDLEWRALLLLGFCLGETGDENGQQIVEEGQKLFASLEEKFGDEELRKGFIARLGPAVNSFDETKVFDLVS